MATTAAAKPSEALSQLLFPVDVNTFIGEFAGRKSLLIKGGVEKFAALQFDREAFFRSAERLQPDRLKAAGKTTGEAESYEAIRPDQVRERFAAGRTVCAAGISDANERLGAFAEAVRYSLSIGDLRFNSYLSPDDSGFNLHYDAQPIFLMQMEGQKKWWYAAEPVMPTPTVYSSAWDNKPPLDSLVQTVLEPGDVLYLPGFTWHRARAIDFSLGITLGTKGVHNSVLQLAMEQSPTFSEWPIGGELQPPIDPASCRPGEVPSAARAYLQRQLQELQAQVANLTVEQLWDVWMDLVQSPKGPRLPAADAELFRDQTLRLSSAFPIHLDRRGEGVRIACCGKSFTASARASATLEWVIGRGTQPFTVREAIEVGTGMGLTRSETKHLLRDLAATSAIEPVSQ